MRTTTLTCCLPIVLLVSAGCDSAAVVEVELANTTPVASQGGVVPTAFAIRLSKIYLSESVDAQQLDTGAVTIVWQNRCTAPSGDACFFDLARSTAALNEDLHSEPSLAKPGTYRFVRLEMCRTRVTSNVIWKDGQMPGPRELTHEYCAVTSKPFDPPVVLDAGDAVRIALTYDLSAMVATISEAGSAGAGDPPERFLDCVEMDGVKKTCISPPTLVPSIKKLQ